LFVSQGTGASLFVGLRAQNIVKTSTTSPGSVVVVGGVNPAICLLDIDSVQAASNGTAVLSFASNALVAAAVRQLTVTAGSASAVNCSGSGVLPGTTVDLQIGTITMTNSATGNAISITNSTNVIMGFIDSITTSTGAAVFEDSTSTGGS